MCAGVVRRPKLYSKGLFETHGDERLFFGIARMPSAQRWRRPSWKRGHGTCNAVQLHDGGTVIRPAVKVDGDLDCARMSATPCSINDSAQRRPPARAAALLAVCPLPRRRHTPLRGGKQRLEVQEALGPGATAEASESPRLSNAAAHLLSDSVPQL